MRAALLTLYRLLYECFARPFIFRQSAQDAHARAMRLLAWLDEHPRADFLLRWAHDLAYVERPLLVGGVRLTHPLILAAGFVKGEGFADEQSALAAVRRSIIPGWRSLPLLLGAVEYGSFTRWPRLGNPGLVLWRDEPALSTQNRIGLKNPGAAAAAAFLERGRRDLPPIFGINVAVSPGISDAARECQEVIESLSLFLDHGVRPSWFTLNLSCPNTEDDPGSRQTEARARTLCVAAVAACAPTPLWVKISPALADEQYRVLLGAFVETGVRAVIATNTLGQPAPDGSVAGLGGGRLRDHALAAVRLLAAERSQRGYSIDIVASGGVLDGTSYRAFASAGAAAAQYMTGLIYRGPLAAALIASEGEALL